MSADDAMLAAAVVPQLARDRDEFDRWMRATYRIRASAQSIGARAQALALEQSVELPLEAVTDARVLHDVVARVETIVAAAPDAFDVTLRIATETTGFEAGQLLNMLFGNASLQDDVTLLDADFPRALASAFGGPRFGVAGIREITGAYGRPLTCAALKPQGLTAEQLASIAHTLARGGIDVIKDDHGLADQRAARFVDRVRCVQRAVSQANEQTGGRCAYAPSVTGSLADMREQIAHARAEGVQMFLVAPMVAGVANFAALAREMGGEGGRPLIAHPALGGAARIAPALLLGKLFRLFGADATIFPNAGGRFSYTTQTCAAIAAAARDPWHDLAPTIPVPAGGMSIARVPEMRTAYGDDAMLLIGGSLLVDGEHLLMKTREFVAAAHAGVD